MILLDEPFSALDGYLKDVLQKDMQEFLHSIREIVDGNAQQR